MLDATAWALLRRKNAQRKRKTRPEKSMVIRFTKIHHDALLSREIEGVEMLSSSQKSLWANSLVSEFVVTVRNTIS